MITVFNKREKNMSKTPTSQRILFGFIAIFMVVSTVGMYVSMVMTSKNQNNQPQYPASPRQTAEQKKRLDKYMKQVEERSKYLQKIGDELSAKYYDEFKAYKTANKAYNAESIKELTKTDLKVGDGAEVDSKTEYRAYYIGWLADGKVFDSSFDNDKLKAPLQGGSGLIEGWKEGIKGMKIGGVREIAIPYQKAYGDQKKGDIPAKSPLKFIIKLIPPMTKEQKAGIPKAEF